MGDYIGDYYRGYEGRILGVQTIAHIVKDLEGPKCIRCRYIEKDSKGLGILYIPSLTPNALSVSLAGWVGGKNKSMVLWKF